MASVRQLNAVYAEVGSRLETFEANALEDLARELAAEREVTRRSEYSSMEKSAIQAEENRMTTERLRMVMLWSEEFYQTEAMDSAELTLRNSVEQSARQVQADEAATSLYEMRAQISTMELNAAQERRSLE